MPTPVPTAHTIALGELPDAPPDDTAPLAPRPTNPLHKVVTQLQVVVGTCTMTVGELMALRGGQVLPLEQALDAPVDVVLEGQVVARGVLVAVDECFAVRLTELPMLLAP